MQPVNDNLKAEVKNNKCLVHLNGMRIHFYKILEAKAFIDEYYARPL